MFEYMIGKVLYKTNNYLIVENNYLGYKIFVGNPYKFEENTSTKIFVSTKILQNNKSNLIYEYYGFKTLKEKIFFETLLSINGIGPKTGLLILKNDLDLIKELIRNEDIDSLSVLEGFNNKIALSVIGSLSYKLKNERIAEYSNSNINSEKDNNSSISNYNPIPDLISALKSLGYKKQMIEKAINILLPEINKTTEDGISDLISKAIKVIFNETASSQTTVS